MEGSGFRNVSELKTISEAGPPAIGVLKISCQC